MTAYLIRRILWLPVVLLTVALITYALGLYGPGDPVQVALGQRTNPEVVERIRQQWGLDDPFAVQFARYVGRAVRGDFGESYKFRGEAVGGLLRDRILVSAQLALVAMVLSFAIGIPLGLFAAMHQGSWLDRLLIGCTLLGISVPVFVVAPIVQYLLVVQLKLLPSSGWDGIFSAKTIMPALVLGTPPVAGIARQTRAAVLDVLGMDYVRTARSKGLPESTVRFRHVLRNALIPVVTILGLFIAELPTGALIVEQLFGIPGVGRLAFDSIFARDYPVIMAFSLVVAASYVVVNLLTDLAYPLIDPRVRYQ